MKVVYIAGRFRAPTHFGVVQNVRAAEAVALAVWRTGLAAALCPHLNCANFEGAAPDSVWLEGGLELLRRSDAVVLVDGWRTSKGTAAEVALAFELHRPVFRGYGALGDEIPDWDSFLDWLRKES